MIIGVGHDLVAIDRIARLLLRHGERMRRKLFTPREQEYCDRHVQPAPRYAARFAAKEACAKALGTGMRDGIWFTDIEVVASPLGAPGLLLHGPAAARLAGLAGGLAPDCLLSLSHESGFAAAVVILQGASKAGET